MKRIFFVACMALVTATTACAQQSKQVSQSTGVNNAARPMSSQVYDSGKCHFRTRLVHGQAYSHAAGDSYMFYDAKPASWGFPIHCHAGASQDEIDTILEATKLKGRWVWSGDKEPFTPQEGFKAYEFAGSNWKGVGVAYNATIGDPSTRQRHFNFCLVQIHGPQALCGRTQVNTVGLPESYSTLPKILAVLKTIVFVNPPANAPAAAETAGGH